MGLEIITFPQPVSYALGLRLQEELVARRLAGEIGDTALLLEHEPVITLGIRAKAEHILLPPDELARRGIAVHTTPRGGDVTYHGPGQLVLYPIVMLEGPAADVHAYVASLEEIALRTAQAFGIEAYRRPGKTGIWTPAGKLAAIGVRFHRWVSSHGLSLNVDVAPGGFSAIVPCGLHGEPVASLATLLGPRCPSRDEVARVLRNETLLRLVRTR